MRRFTPIRITENDRKEYAKLVRNSKAKIARTHKKYGINLSGEIDLPPMQNFKTRNDFNEWKEKAQSFTNRHNLHYQFVKNDYGVVASKKEINKVVRDTKNAQRIADEKRKKAEKLPFISGGKQQGTVEQRLLMMKKPSVAGIVRPTDFDFKKVHSQQQFNKKKENMEKRADRKYLDERTERMKNNFILLLEFNFNSDAEKLADDIERMPADDFYELYLQQDEFDFDKYDSENVGGISDNGKIEQMQQAVDEYWAGKTNMDLKGF